jgi:uncharacterized cupredoxin-like copper-binding protein
MRRFFSFAVLFSFLLSACCGRPNPTTTSINAALDEYAITPMEWRIPAGQNITLKLNNLGKKAHEWVLLKDLPTEPFSADDEANVLFRTSIPPGTSQTVTFKAPTAPGEYSVTSSLPGDLEGGMLAKLIVVQPGY